MANPRGFSQGGTELLYAELAKRGISLDAASGAIAGIMGESGANLDPTAFNTQDPGGGSGGIGQWNQGRLVGPNGMLAFAKNAGVPIDVNNPLDAKKVPLNVQAQYLGHELDTTYSGVRNQLQVAKTPQDALNIWVNSYENPADKRAAIAQRSQYLAPVGQTLNSLPISATTPGAPTPSAGGPAAPAAPGAPAAAQGNWMTKLASALKPQDKAAGSGGEEQPPDFRLNPVAPAQAAGGRMMMGSGGQNTFGRNAAEQGLAQQGFMTQPSLAAFNAYKPPSPIGAPSPGGATPGSAEGVPTMPGTTLNSPGQLQMAMATGQMDPNQAYSDLYNQLFGGQRGGYGMGSA